MNDRSNDRRPPPPSSSRNNNYDRQERGKHFEQALKAEDDRSYDRSYDTNVYEDNANDRARTRNARGVEIDEYPRRMTENSTQNDRNEGDYARKSRLPQSGYSREQNPADYQRPNRNEWDISGYDNYSDSKNNHQWQHCDREENDYEDKGRYYGGGTEVTQKPSCGRDYDSKDYDNDTKPHRKNYRNDSNEEPLRRGGGENRVQESVGRNQSTNYGPARGDKNDGYGRGDGGYGNSRGFGEEKYVDRGYDDKKPSRGTTYDDNVDKQHGYRNPAPYSVEDNYLPAIKENPRSQYPVKDDYYPPPARTNTAQRNLDTVPYCGDETLHFGGRRQPSDGREYSKDEERDIYPPAAANPERYPAPTTKAAYPAPKTKAANSEWDENYDRYNSRYSRQSEYKSPENYGPPQRKDYGNDEAERGYGNGGRKGEEYDLPQRSVPSNTRDSAPQRYGSNVDVGRNDCRPPPENSNFVDEKDSYPPVRSTQNESDRNVNPYINQDRKYSRDQEATRLSSSTRIDLNATPQQVRDDYGLPRTTPNSRPLYSRPTRHGSTAAGYGSTRSGEIVGGGYDSTRDGNGGYERHESRATLSGSTTGGYDESRPARGNAAAIGGDGYHRASNNDDKYPSDRGNSKQQESGYGRLPPPPSTIERRPLTDSRPYNNNQTDPSQDYSNRREKQYANSPSNGYNNDRSGYGNNPRGGYGASTRGGISSRGAVGGSATTFANNPTRGSSSRPPAVTNATPRPIPVISENHKPPSSPPKAAAPPENTDDEWN